MRTAPGFGVSAGLDPEIAAPLAARCEELGYGSIWTGDNPAADGLQTLADLATGSDRLELGVGALGLDRRTPDSIAAEVDRLGLDPSRLLITVGSGRAEHPLQLMRISLVELRRALPGARILLAAMGPGMCRLAGRAYDGVLLSWFTPEHGATARGWVEAGASEAGRPTPRICGYIRAAVGPDAETRLARDEGFHRALHEGYRAHFARLRAAPGTIGVEAEIAAEIPEQVEAYSAPLDTPVVRGLSRARLESISKIAAAAASIP